MNNTRCIDISTNRTKQELIYISKELFTETIKRCGDCIVHNMMNDINICKPKKCIRKWLLEKENETARL